MWYNLMRGTDWSVRSCHAGFNDRLINDSSVFFYSLLCVWPASGSSSGSSSVVLVLVSSSRSVCREWLFSQETRVGKAIIRSPVYVCLHTYVPIYTYRYIYTRIPAQTFFDDPPHTCSNHTLPPIPKGRSRDGRCRQAVPRLRRGGPEG